jgi:hypothetical protein
MTVDPSRVELVVSSDQRLIAALDVVIAHAGARAGLSVQEQKDLIRAANEACDETLSLLRESRHSDPRLRVLVCDFPNRVEVSVEQSDGALADPASRPGPAAARGNHVLESALRQINVDRLHHEIHEGRFRTTLVKYHSAAKPQGHR